MCAEHSLLRKRRNKNSLTPKPDLHCIPFSVHFLQKQSATRDYLSDSFGTGNAFLLVLFQSLHGRVPVIPEEHIRCLTLVNPECSTYCSQEIWADTTRHSFPACWHGDFTWLTETANAMLPPFPGYRHPSLRGKRYVIPARGHNHSFPFMCLAEEYTDFQIVTPIPCF